MKNQELSEPVCITQTANEEAGPEVLPLIVVEEPQAVVDPLGLLDRQVIGFDDVEGGDWIGKSYWRRPRLVKVVDGQIFLAEPDQTRATDGIRAVSREVFESHTWVRYPNLRTLWDAAHLDA